MRRSLFAVGFLALAGSLTLGAQSMRLEAKIPFDFRIGEKAMPAGDYTVIHSDGVLRVRNFAGKTKNAMCLVRAAHKVNGEGAAKLVFHRYGNEYFLSAVWQWGGTSGVEVPRTKLEREYAARATGPVLTAVRVPAK
jgi:hypothetical protein